MNNKLLEKFELYCSSLGLSKVRIRKYHYTMITISKFLNKDLNRVTKDDIVRLLAKIQNYVNPETKKPYSPYTKHDFKVTIKKFWKFLGKEKMVSWIKVTIKRNELQLPSIITRDDTVTLIQSCKTIRDKALVSVLFESGCRIGELLSLAMNNIEFDSYGAVLIVNGKTGSRRIRICGKAVDYLKEYVIDKNPTEKVFPVSYPALRKVLKTIGKRAKLNKEIHFHMFRHGRATELANQLTEQELDIFMGWEIASNMPRTYVHLSGKDIDKKILQISGVTKEQKLDSALDKMRIKEPELYNALKKFVRKEMV